MKKYTGIFFTAAIVWGQFGCKKQLNALPNDALVDGNTITSQQTANIALNGVYYRFANASATNTDWIDNQIDGGMLTGYMDDGTNTLDEATNVLGNTSMNSVWGREYTLINVANMVIEGVNKLSDKMFSNNRKQQILAEARFMRAYGHFKLLSWFGQWYDINSAYGVILRSDFITSTNFPQARAGVKDSYDFILDDVNYAVANAADVSPNINVSRWAAMALKMRVLLNRGQGDDYALCASLGDSIISGSPYALETNLKDVFYSAGLGSNEVMLGVQPQAGQDGYYYNTSGNYVKRSSYYVATDALNDLLATDPRKAWIIGGAGARGKGYFFIKYVQPSLKTTLISEVAYAFRLSEVYLMEAEAIARSGGALNTAKDLLKTVLTHAGVTDFTAVDGAVTAEDLEKQLYYEYVRNFIGEDDMYYRALLRFPLATVTQLRPTITSKEQYILPIPHDEFTSNPLIGDQNPGYAK